MSVWYELGFCCVGNTCIAGRFTWISRLVGSWGGCYHLQGVKNKDINDNTDGGIDRITSELLTCLVLFIIRYLLQVEDRIHTCIIQ